MQERICSLIRMKPPVHESNGLLFASGATVPADATVGYQTGCIFQHTDGGTGTALYINEGDETSCNFDAIAALTAAQEAQLAANVALLSATAGVATASKALILDANGQVASGPTILSDGAMAAGTGITTATGGFSYYRVTRIGELYKTEIFIDITGLNDGDTAADVIGKDGDTVNCHIGQITAAVNGTIFAARVSVTETPGTAHADIDIWRADEGTLAQDTAISAGTNQAKLFDGDTLAANDILVFSALPAADSYMYLVTGTQGGDADYDAGIILLELWGV